jgi:hypothetical protein
MKRFCSCWFSIGALLLSAFLGCGDAAPPPVDVNAEAKAKVEAFKNLADAMAKEPNGLDARSALEEIRNRPLDVTKNREEAEEIVKIYRERIRGKYQGEVPQEVQIEVSGIESQLKQKG